MYKDPTSAALALSTPEGNTTPAAVNTLQAMKGTPASRAIIAQASMSV
jgi:hypothetical protein